VKLTNLDLDNQDWTLALVANSISLAKTSGTLSGGSVNKATAPLIGNLSVGEDTRVTLRGNGFKIYTLPGDVQVAALQVGSVQ
jgi:hypothetical protein